MMFNNVIFIISPPRSGSTLLFEQLVQGFNVASTQGENHLLIETISGLGVHESKDLSNRLDASHASPVVSAELLRRLSDKLIGRTGSPAKSQFIFLEKTPKNSLRIPFFQHIFPNAKFLYLYRSPEQTISSMMDGWLSRKFVTYRQLGGWDDAMPWSFLLIPGWRELAGKSLAEITSSQWQVTTDFILRDLTDLPRSQVASVNFEMLISSPTQTLEHIARWTGIELNLPAGLQLPLSRSILSPPAPDKWIKNRTVLMPELQRLMPLKSRAEAFVSEHDVALSAYL